MTTILTLPSLLGHPPTALTTHVAFDPSGVRLVSWSDDGVRVWSPEDGVLVRHVAGRPSEVSVSDRGARIVAGYKDRAVLYDVDAGQVLRSWPSGWDWVEDLAVTPSGDQIVIGDDSPERVLRYDAATGARLPVPEDVRTGHPRAFSPAGVLYWSDPEYRMHAWDPRTGESWADLRPGIVARWDWSAGGAWFATTVWDPAPRGGRLWDQGRTRIRGPDGAELELPVTGYDLALSADGALVALAVGDEIRLIDTRSGATVAEIQAPGVCSVDLGADSLLAAGTLSGPVLLFRLQP